MSVGRATDGLLRANARSSGLTTIVFVTTGPENVVPRETALSSGDVTWLQVVPRGSARSSGELPASAAAGATSARAATAVLMERRAFMVVLLPSSTTGRSFGEAGKRPPKRW